MSRSKGTALRAPARSRSDRRGSPRKAERRLAVGWVLAGLLALVPVGRMVGIVLDGSALQFADYWWMLPRFASADGGLDVGGVLTFNNVHPMVLPQLAYWLNIQLFAGSNIALGLFVVALGVGELVLILLLLRQTTLPAIQQMLVLLLASVLLFNPAGTWNFWKAMSGTAWFAANLLALAAVYLRSRDLRWLAAGAAVLASVSYGTGIAAWLAVLVVGMVRRPWREWWREAPYAVGFVLTFLWYQVAGTPEAAQSPATVLQVVQASADLLGFVLGLSGGASEAVGYVPLVGVPVLSVVLLRSPRSPGVAGLVGLATFGWVALVAVTYGRANNPFDFSSTSEIVSLSRYVSLPALTWIGFVGLCLLALDRVGVPAPAGALRRAAGVAVRWVPVAATIALLVGAVTAGRQEVDEMQALRVDQERWEVAVRFDLTKSATALVAPGEAEDVADQLERIGHHPFTGSWDLDCGRSGEQVDSPRPDDRVDGAIVSTDRSILLGGAVTMTGYLETDDDIRCVVVTDPSGAVVGAATVGTVPLPPGAPAGATAFSAVAAHGEDSYRVMAMLGGRDTPVLLDDVEPAS